MVQENLSAKEIKEGISPTPWHACHEGECSCGQIWSEPQDFPVLVGTWKEEELGEIKIEQMKTNVKAATIAVNNTYGKGLNPEVYEDIENVCRVICDDHFNHRLLSISHLNELAELLNKSRI